MKTKEKVVVENTSITEKQEQQAVPEQMKPSGTSEAKQEANRRNAQCSTGPKTPRGKRNSSLNAVKHGMLSNKALYDENGRLKDEDLYAFRQDLFKQYGSNDVRTQVLVDLAVADYSRNMRAFEIERKSKWLEELALVHRYSVSNRKALIDDLKALADLRAERIAEQDEEACDEQDEGTSAEQDEGTCDELDETTLESQAPLPGEATEPPILDDSSSEDVATRPPDADSSSSEIPVLPLEIDAVQGASEMLQVPLEEAPASAQDAVTGVPEASHLEALPNDTDPALSTTVQ
jgi:hypothetical protein